MNSGYLECIGRKEHVFEHSIILSSFNRPVFVRHAIRSVLSQSRTGFELFVADDGSTGETVLAIKDAFGNDDRCTLVAFAPPARGEQRRGVHRLVSNINQCLERISGDIVHYLADDDFYDERRLERFDALFLDERVTVGYGMLAYVDRAGCLTGEIRYPDRIEDPYRVLDHNQVVHQRSVLHDCGPGRASASRTTSSRRTAISFGSSENGMSSAGPGIAWPTNATMNTP